MYITNERNELIDVQSLKAELANFTEAELLSQDEMEAELSTYYMSALNDDCNMYGVASPALTAMAADDFSVRRIGRGILRRIKEFICKVLGEDATVDQIIDAILNALATIIPGGRIIAFLVKKLIRFVIDLGIGKFCAI